MSEEEYNSERYSYRLFFTKEIANRRGQADRVLEFLDPSSELAQEIDKEYWVKKEVERPKFRVMEICEMMQAEGFTRFYVHYHTQLWKSHNARDSALGFGVEVSGYWYWYERWIEVVRKHCQDNKERYT